MTDIDPQYEISDTVRFQLEHVRRDGRVNMFDIDGVHIVAADLTLYDLMDFITKLDGLSRGKRSRYWIEALKQIRTESET